LHEKSWEWDGVTLPINLEQKDIKDVKIELLNEPAPEDEAIAHILKALYHIGRQTDDPNGFWIMANQVVQWLGPNGFKDHPKLNDPIQVGHILKKCKFKQTKRMGAGVYRWINRELLMGLIDDFNVAQTTTEQVESHYLDVKLAVFQAYLNDEDVEDLPFDLTLIQQATKEYTEMGEDEVRQWLEGIG